MHHKTPNDPITQKAISWMVELYSGEMDAEQRAEFEAWRRKDQRHEQTCQRIEAMMGELPKLVASSSLRNTISTQSVSRRQLLNAALSIAFFGTTSAFVANRITPLEGFLTDIHTGTAERKTAQLNDASIITLNARSSADVQIDSITKQRHVRLVQGEIHLQAQKMWAPLSITTDHGKISIVEGTVNISLEPEGTRLSVLSGAAVATNQANQTIELQKGQGAFINPNGFIHQDVDVNTENAWLNGFIHMNAKPLGKLISSLQAYRTGLLRISPDAAKLRVSGIYSLDESNKTLDSLVQTLPIEITKTTGYWVSISLA